MPSYNNRLSGSNCCTTLPKGSLELKGRCSTKNVKPENPVSDCSKGKDSNTLGKTQCNKKILSITKVGCKVVVMYDDCSYTTAPLEVIAKEAFAHETLQCLIKSMKILQENQKALRDKVKELSEQPDTVYDDSKLKERLTALESKEDNDTIYDDSEVRRALEMLQTALNEINKTLPKLVNKNELVIVENLEGTRDLFKAFPL